MTEKEYTSTRERKTMSKQTRAADAKKTVIPKKEEAQKKVEEVKPEETKPEKKKIEKKKTVTAKKESAHIRGVNVPISKKYSRDICKFIKGKTIQKAIFDLEDVLNRKKAIPMKGEIPHKKGKIMSGRYPKIASEYFIKILKTLSANANVNGLENPVIVEAISSIGQRPYGRFGTVRRKRTHIMIKVKEKAEGEKK